MFSQLATTVQLAIVIGIVALTFLFACSRRAGENFLLFLQGLRSVLWMRDDRKERKTSSRQNSQILAQYRQEGKETILTNGIQCRRNGDMASRVYEDT